MQGYASCKWSKESVLTTLFLAIEVDDCIKYLRILLPRLGGSWANCFSNSNIYADTSTQ